MLICVEECDGLKKKRNDDDIVLHETSDVPSPGEDEWFLNIHPEIKI